MVHGEEGQLEAVRDPGLREDFREVMRDGLLADRELLRNIFFVRATLHDRSHNLLFPRREMKTVAGICHVGVCGSRG